MHTLLWFSLLVAAASALTVWVRPVSASLDQDTRQAEYYAEQSEDDDGPILVSRQYIYGRAIQEQVFRPTAPPTPKATFIPQPAPKQPQGVRITLRPALVVPATTYQPRLQEVTASPATTRTFSTSHRTSSSTGLDSDDEFKTFQLKNNVVSMTSKPYKGMASDSIYSTELVFGSSSGQYNTVLNRARRQTVGGKVNPTGRLQTLVDNPFSPYQFFTPQRPLPYQQDFYQETPAQLLRQAQKLLTQQQMAQKTVSSVTRLKHTQQVA